MKKEIDRRVFKELLLACKELLEHAEWMGTPSGYGSRDFRDMFDRANKAIQEAKKQ